VVEDLTTVKKDFAAHKVTNAIQKWNSTSNELPSDLPQAIGENFLVIGDTVQNWLSYLVTGGINLGIYNKYMMLEFADETS
jgi:hypothetical protein